MPKAAKKGKGQEFDNANRGVLFTNDKGDNEARPDYTGKLNIKAGDYEVQADGSINCRLAAWISQSDKVGEYLRISASPLEERE